jgi:FkbM family methyltransferase
MPYPYGQNKNCPEDVVLTEHFGEAKTDGRFLNVGAWNGVTFDNCRVFAERGWPGVCVEPSPAAFLELMKNYAEFPAVELVNAAVSDKTGLMTFHDCGGDAVSTLNVANRNLWAEGAGTKFRKITVAATTVSRLLDLFGIDFDLLSVDVEGGSASLLREFPIRGMPKLKAIVVEHDGKADDLAAWAREFGFTEPEGTRSGENLILLR